MKFELKSQDPKSKARAGKITTDHGVIETPIFMPVGTVGTVKGVHQTELKTEINPDIILGNTYHLYLRPTIKILEQAGGLHKFMNWDRNILTDSGGYQVYSLSGRRKINEEGVKFKSHIDGSMHFFTPENVMEIQRSIGADIIMAFDECTPYPCDYNYAKRSMHMTHRWLKRCINHLDKTPLKYDYNQTFFPIVQGSTYEDLRIKSALETINIDFEGYAVGGLAVGEGHDEMIKVLEYTLPILPDEKVRYLMGVGRPENIIESVSKGIDIFDCVIPTREGRHGHAYCNSGTLNLRNKIYENDNSPLDEESNFSISKRFSKGYIHHLIKSKEPLGGMIISWHNLNYYKKLMEDIRLSIIEGSFDEFKENFYLRRSSDSKI